MKSFLKETNIKIGLIGLMIIVVIFLSKYQKANSEFNISDMSIVNSIEKIEEKILETPKVEGKSKCFYILILIKTKFSAPKNQFLKFLIKSFRCFLSINHNLTYL